MIAPIPATPGRWVMRLGFDLKSKNRTARNTRAASFAFAALRGKLVSALKFEADRIGIPRYRDTVHVAQVVPEADRPPFRSITLTRLMGKTAKGAWQVPFDDDGWSGGASGLRDAFQRQRARAMVRKGVSRMILVPGAGIVWDDSAKWSRWEYRQERSHDGRPGVLVTVEDAEGPSPTPIADMVRAAVTDRPDVMAVLVGEGKRR